MTEIKEGLVFAATKTDLTMPGPYRVLQVIPEEDGLDHRVVLIPVPTGPRRSGKQKQASYYARGFLVEKLSTLDQWVDAKLFKKTDAPPSPARWALTDQQIVDACSAKKRIWVEDTKEGKGRWTTSSLAARDRKWDLIRPLVELGNAGGVRDLSCLDAKVEARAKEAGVSPGQVFDALHRFYAFGSVKNTLLPATHNCGSPGTPRFGKNGKRLGRKNAAAAVGNIEMAGKISDETDRQNIHDGYAMYVRPGTSVPEAFTAFSATFYSSGSELKHGMRVPILLPANQRPTEREFRFHGPQGGDRYGAARRQLGEGEWARDYRPLIGSARDGIPSIGQVSTLDASPTDVNTNAIFDRLCPVGVSRGLFVREARIGLWLGWHVAIGGIGTDAAKLGILRAVTDKSDVLKRLDLEDLPSEDFVGLLSTKYLSDNGELRSIDGIKSCVDQLTSGIEFIARGRADRNSISEAGHHSRHRRFDHYLAGSTRGRPAKRGEPLAITKALLNRYEYERLLVLWMHWANTKQRVPHLVPTEMRREMQGQKYEPTRIAIYRWAKKAGYVVSKPIDPLLLRAHLLPTFTASVKRNGLFLHRPGTGEAVELLHDAHFNDGYLDACGLYRSFGRYDKPHVQVKADPDDLSHVLLVDGHGIHVIPNVSDDVILVREACVADLCAKNDLTKRENVESRTQTDQDASDQRAFRQATEEPAKAEKAAAIAERGKVSPSDRKRPSVRANQAKDNAAHLAESAARARSASTTPAPRPPDIALPAPAQPHLVLVPPSAGSSISAAMQARLANFHKDRGT